MSTLRIFIGTDASQALPCAVLRHSIRKHTDAELAFTELNGVECGGVAKNFYTGFSFYRWAVPEMCREGLAVYMDADIVVNEDIAKLFALADGKSAVRARRLPDSNQYFTSVMLMDCQRCAWKFSDLAARAIDKGFYKDCMWGHPGSPVSGSIADLPAEWNVMDQSGRMSEPGACANHFTVVPTQPWKRPEHPDEKIFLNAVFDWMLDYGGDAEALILAEEKKGHVYAGFLGRINALV